MSDATERATDPATEWVGSGEPTLRPAPTSASEAARAAGGDGGGVVRSVAYFSMEVGLEPSLPTYSGGLGVLAGDTLRAAADLGVPMVAVTLLHRKGYFRQELDADGRQEERPAEWSPDQRLEPTGARVTVEIEGRPVHLRAWRLPVRGRGGFAVPLYFLDSNLPENTAGDRELTDRLYGGDLGYRLAQEVVLGLGGLRMLRELGHRRIRTYHMNEGHSALLTLGLLDEARQRHDALDDAVEEVRSHCVFTTHTPVPAGHDQFSRDLARRVIGAPGVELLGRIGDPFRDSINLTHVALHFSRYLNGVAMRHREVSRELFPGYPVRSITNGVHVRTWVSPPFRELYDRHIPAWRDESFNLRYAVGIPTGEVADAHDGAKRQLLDEVESRTGRALDPDALTLGFARRATTYKRADLLISRPDRLRRIAREVGPLQILYAGKAHPADEGGQEMIRRVVGLARQLGDEVPVVYLEDYDMALAAKLVAGADLWVNTPQKPQEASGTSGMKAALNGVPSLSVLDGWWIEGHVEGVTGWSIGEDWRTESDPERETESMYGKLEEKIAPLFHRRPMEFAAIRRSSITLNGSFFNAERMMLQYAINAYGLPTHARVAPAGVFTG